MTSLRRSVFGVLVALLLAATFSASAQTTGGMLGIVTDEQGSLLPGVTVEATSPNLPGIRIAVTNAQGQYRFPLLPPGPYQIVFELKGFAKQTRADVVVNLGHDSSLDTSLKVATSTEVTVTGEAPVVDTTTAALGANLSTRQVETLPTGRNYSSIVQVVPGVSSDATTNQAGTDPDQKSITVYGSTGAENSFYIDGVNTTGAEYGFQGKALNYEFIQAVDVKTGGYEAEYGRSTGGIVNVITKSGGNEFHGDVFGYFDNDSLQADTDTVVSTAGTVVGITKKDFGIDVGGYFLKDKIWFFGAYDKVKNTVKSSLPAGPAAGQVVASDTDRDLASAKLTFKLTPSHAVIGTFFQDPTDVNGAIVDGDHALNGEPLTYLGVRNLGGRDFALRYEGLFGSTVVANAQVSRHKEQNSIGPATSAGDAVEYRAVDNDFFQTGGFGLIQNKNFKRDAFLLNGTLYLNHHEIKAGVEYEKESADVVKRMSGGQRVDVYPNAVHPSQPIYRHFYWTTVDATVENAPLSALIAAPEHKVTSLFLQDRFTPLSNLTINAGIRWDKQEIIDASGATQINLDRDFAPRFGFIWDPSKNHKTKVFGSYGRYYEQLSMDLVIRSFSYERQPRIYNYSATDFHPNAAAESDAGDVSRIAGGLTEPADPNLRNQFLHEYILGAEHEIAPDFALGIKGVYRNYGEVIEDFTCSDAGDYCIGNPGKGIMEKIITYDFTTFLPAPEARRVYKGIQLDATKRFSNGWYAQASYILSKLDGNFDGLFAPFTNIGADPNISAAYDYYDFFTNGRDLTRITNNGPLSNDRRHQFKVSGVYSTPFGLSVGLSGYFQSGTPLTRYGYADGYGRYEFFLTERGAEGRSPETYEMDLHLGYPIRLGPVTVNALLDVFNLLNAQRPLLLDQRWGFQESDNSSATPVNPNYLQPVLRTGPRTLRLGLRVSF